MTYLDEIATRGHIASALLFIAVAVVYYVFYIADRDRSEIRKR